MKKQELHDLIREFALKQTGPFEFDALENYVRRKVKRFDAEDRLYDLTCGSDWLFADDREMFSDSFMPRHVCFKAAEFRATPVEEEVAGGYLIPGHRLIPFISREVCSADAVLKLPDGSAAPKRTVQISVAEAHRFLMYFGEYGAIDYLIQDHESNEESLQPPYEGAVSVTVFDLRAFYAQCGFKTGDALMLTVVDWLKGVYSVRPVPAKQSPVDLSKTRKWIDALRLGFDEARQEARLDHDCYEQMARMLWLASVNEDAPPVLSDPPLSLAAFFNMQKDLKIQTTGQVSFFWPEGEPVESRLMNSLESGEMEPESELEAFFIQLGLSMTSEEAGAYMRDALSRGEENPEEVLVRVISGRTLSFQTANDQREFHRLWHELWQEVRKTYNPQKDSHREMRAVFLDLNDQCLAVLRTLDRNQHNPSSVISNPATLQLGELSALIHSALVLCNQKSEEQADELPMPLDDVAQGISAAIEELSGQFQQMRLVKSSMKRLAAVYQLKISLKYSRPPIWRRVLVPSDIELEALHAVIQTAFGWTNSHLHQFVASRTFYQPEPEDEGFMGMTTEDSAGVCLQDLLSKEKDKIVYEYDFGDSWEHDVVLEKVLPADPEQPLPVCIKGKRACPPEDCGGIPGYFHLLETLSGPDCEEKKDLLDWLAEPIDPEAFDLDEVNARLQRWC